MSHWTDQPQVQVNHVHDTFRLTEFLLARLDEEEAMARAAIDDDSGQDGGFEDAYEDLTRPPSGVGIAQGGFGEAAARMIVWNTPRRVLADIRAKRSMITRARTYASAVDEQERRGEDTTLMLPRWSEWDMAMRYIGLVHVDHPEYRREWRP